MLTAWVGVVVIFSVGHNAHALGLLVLKRMGGERKGGETGLASRMARWWDAFTLAGPQCLQSPSFNCHL